MKHLLCLCVILLLGACSSVLLSFDTHAEQDFQQAIKQHDFKRAETIAKYLPPKNPDYAAVRKHLGQLKSAEENFRDHQIQLARQHAEKKQWQQAIDILNQASTSLPSPDKKLDAAKQDLLARENSHIKQAQAHLLVDEAHWLLDQQDTLNELSNASQADVREQAQSLLQTRVPLSEQLQKLGIYFARQQDWYTTRDCLLLAEKLGNHQVPQALLDRARKQLAQDQTRERNRQRQKLRHQAQSLLQHYQHSHLIADLLTARDYVKTHNRDGDLDDIAGTLDELARQRMKHDMHVGDTLYASGHYQSADRIWRRLAPLYPHNPELSKKLERVEKVLHSLHALEGK